MPTQAKKAREVAASSISRGNIQRRETESRRSRTQEKDNAAQPRYSFAPVKVEQQGTKNPFEIATIFGGYSVSSSIESQVKLLPILHKTCLAVFPDWKHTQWPEETTLYDMVKTMVDKIVAYCETNDMNLDFNEHQGYYTVTRRIYRDDGYTKFCSVDWVVELDKVDPQLAEILLAVMGKMIKQYNIKDWQDCYNLTIEWIREWMSEVAEDKDEIETTEADIEAWVKGEPTSYYKKMMKLGQKSHKWIKDKVKAYNWNTYHRKRLLVWIRLADRILKEHPSTVIYDYCNSPESGGEYLHPCDYLGFIWNDNQENVIDYHHNQWYQTNWENADFSGYNKTYKLTDNPSLEKDTFPKMIDRWMAYSCFLFHRDFMKEYKGKKVSKLINKLLDD